MAGNAELDLGAFAWDRPDDGRTTVALHPAADRLCDAFAVAGHCF
jgi:hypothetical protein